MNRFRPAMLVLFTSTIIALLFFGAQLKVPTALAYQGGAGSFNPAMPSAVVCTPCHSGTTPAGGNVVVNFPTGMAGYTPGGPAIPISVVVTDPSLKETGFYLTAVFASNLASTAGTFSGPSSAGGIQSNGPAEGSSNSTNSYSLTWTPPPTGTTDSVKFFVTGIALPGSTGNNSFYSANYTLAPATAATPPSITSFTAGAATITSGKSTTLTAMFSGGTGTISGVTGTVTSGIPVTVTPSVTTTYMLTVTPTTGTAATKTAMVAVVAAPVINSFTAGTNTLTATFTGGTGMIGGVGAVTSGTPVNVTPSATTTYTLTVTNAATTPATASATATITVNAPPPPPPPSAPVISSFAPASATITAGTSTTLTAVFSNGTGAISGVGTVTSGTPVTVTPTATTTYTLRVVNNAATPPTATASTMVTVNPSTGTGTLAVSPASLAFSYRMGGSTPGSQPLAITSTSGPTSYSATETDPWLSIAPTSGNTPGNLRASINPAGMAAGTYGAQINISTPNGKTITVPVSLTITSGSGGGGTPGNMYAQPYVSNSRSGTLAAAWVNYLGASPNNSNDPHNQGLVLATSATSPSGSMAGAVIQGVSGMSLTELSFDFRTDIPCTSGSPLFQVVAMDGTTHTYGGCKSSPTTPASSAPMGWTHVQFDLTQAPSTLNSQVKSISLVLEQGSSSTGSIAVIDNIQINKVPVGKGAAPTPNPRDD